MLLLPAGCSIEKNTDTTRFYHSLTARFNIYFNGLEAYKAGVAKVNNGYRDDYADILYVFPYTDPTAARLASADMERAIQKASKLISLKSITARPDIRNKRDLSEKERRLLDQKEYNEWVDDSYLLIGKARFYRHEFAEAESVFNYCITEANDPEIRKEASIWLARTRIENREYAEAQRILKELNAGNDDSKDLRSMYRTTLADLYIRQKRYSEAIEPLTGALEDIAGKRTRYRLTYLLAQLHEQAGNGNEATALYRRVVKMNPPYDVEFNARINIAGVFDISSGNPEDIRRELTRMLRDSKNKEFHDQIYFALGNLAMKEGNESEALDYYRRSAASASGNRNQKSRSYLSLSEYFYERSRYIEAGNYLDSAVYFMGEENPQYNELRSRSLNLNQLVSQLVIIEREDSLQRVASLPPEQRNQVISDIIAQVSKAQQTGTSNDYSDRYNIGQYYENERRFQGNIEQEGKWYFYNQSALTFGRTEFRRRWGDRRLEDNWRRSNRSRTGSLQAIPESGNENAPAATDTSSAANDVKSPEYYLKNLPLTDSLVRVSNDRLSTAMLNAGRMFAERINDTTEAVKTLESLISRFPSGPLVPEALYELYRISSSPDHVKAELYRQRLIENFPESEFARILSDPEYFSRKLADLAVTEMLYEEAYNSYSAGQFPEAMTRISDALAKYPDNPLAPKFMLLHSYIVAQTTDERTFKEDLKILIDTYPGTPESVKARELIAHVNEKVPELRIEEQKVIAAELYTADTTSTRIFALVIPDPSFNLNQAAFDVISYNIDYYTNRNYKTESSIVDNKFILVTVSGFTSYSQALDYYGKFNSATPVRNSSGAKMITFVISSENLQKLTEDKDPERYSIFFRENLLKQAID